MDFDPLFTRHAPHLEDFWGRRDNELRHARELHIFGRRIRLASNRLGVLQAADHCQPRYSRTDPDGRPPFELEIVVQPGPGNPGPVPEDVFDRTQYTGQGAWLALHLGRWGHAHVDLTAGRAVAVITPELAARPELVSACLLDTVILNLFIADGFGMLHASCLVRAGHAVLLLAPHNVGKSTTALQLALAGYRLISDSMVFIPSGDTVQLLGFPVGTVKLRADAAARFAVGRPRLREAMREESVRGEVKYNVDVCQIDPTCVERNAIAPAAIDLCLLARGHSQQPHVTRASRAEIADAAMRNSLYLDTRAVWRRNWARVSELLEASRWHHLTLGSDPEALVTAITALRAEPGRDPVAGS